MSKNVKKEITALATASIIIGRPSTRYTIEDAVKLQVLCFLLPLQNRHRDEEKWLRYKCVPPIDLLSYSNLVLTN
jgi:hypothetical protein